jgi:hypothetical protein
MSAFSPIGPRLAVALKSPRAIHNYLLFALAALAFELVLDVRILLPTSLDWMFAFDSDTTQYYFAAAYFRNSHWHFPIGGMETMLHPVGASFTLSDAIPLLGLVVKLLSPLLTVDFQYFGLWLFGCLWLSAIFAKRLFAQLGVAPALAWAGTALITLAPPLVARFGHCGLSAHWLLLAAFSLVLEEGALPKRRIALLAALALFLSSYLFAMVNALLLAAFFVHRRNRRDLALGVAGWFGSIVVSAWVLGYFGLRSTKGLLIDRYYGDLTALFVAADVSTIFPNIELGGQMGKMRDGTAEGFAYLGLGGILLFVALLSRVALPWLRRGAERRLHAAAIALLVPCLLMAFYAFSPSPFVLGERYAGLPWLTELIDPIAHRLRAPGRFWWPFFYYVLVFGIQAVDRFAASFELPRVRGVTLAAAGLVLVQAADVGPWFYAHGRNPAFTDPPRLPTLPAAVRERFSKDTRYLILDPPVARRACRGEKGWTGQYYPLALYGARHDLIVNTDFRATSRLPHEDLEAVCRYTHKLRDEPLPHGMVRVVPEDMKRSARVAASSP